MFNFISGLVHLKVKTFKNRDTNLVLPMHRTAHLDDGTYKSLGYLLGGDNLYLIVIKLLLINKSSKPVTITYFSSKGLGDMVDAYDWFVIYQTDNGDLKISNDKDFSLPYKMEPYGAIIRNVRLCINNKDITKWPNDYHKMINLIIHTSRKRIVKRVVITKFDVKLIRSIKFTG